MTTREDTMVELTDRDSAPPFNPLDGIPVPESPQYDPDNPLRPRTPGRFRRALLLITRRIPFTA